MGQSLRLPSKGQRGTTRKPSTAIRERPGRLGRHVQAVAAVIGCEPQAIGLASDSRMPTRSLVQCEDGFQPVKVVGLDLSAAHSSLLSGEVSAVLGADWGFRSLDLGAVQSVKLEALAVDSAKRPFTLPSSVDSSVISRSLSSMDTTLP